MYIFCTQQHIKKKIKIISMSGIGKNACRKKNFVTQLLGKVYFITHQTDICKGLIKNKK